MKDRLKSEEIDKFRENYRKSGKKKKGELLEAFCSLKGCHRKHAIRLFSRKIAGRPKKPGKRGAKSKYDFPEFITALKALYHVTDRMCARLLHGAIKDWLPAVEKRKGQLSEDVKAKLLTVSARTIERLLHQHKLKFPKTKCGTKPGTIKREQIPIRQGVWQESRPGFMEADTVAHCGNSLSGFFNWTLTMTDIATHWTECRAVWHKWSKGVVLAVMDVEKSLPFRILGFDCDNGGEFINNHLIKYYTEDHPRKNIIQFTRSREYRKNDNAHVEQRNWSHPRQLFFRERLDFQELTELMNDIYSKEFSLLRNHFYPTLKLDHKIMVLSRYRRIYGDAITPYRRVLNSPDVSEEEKDTLIKIHQSLDPIDLKYNLDSKLKSFWRKLRTLMSNCNPQIKDYAA